MTTEPGWGSATLFVVEDDRIITDGLAARLRAEGFTGTQAYGGPWGVAVFERDRTGLVVLDVMLPGFDGNEVCRCIQALRPVPVLMLTARDDESDVLIRLTVGADDNMTSRSASARSSPGSARSSVASSVPASCSGGPRSDRARHHRRRYLGSPRLGREHRGAPSSSTSSSLQRQHRARSAPARTSFARCGAGPTRARRGVGSIKLKFAFLALHGAVPRAQLLRRTPRR